MLPKDWQQWGAALFPPVERLIRMMHLCGFLLEVLVGHCIWFINLGCLRPASWAAELKTKLQKYCWRLKKWMRCG